MEGRRGEVCDARKLKVGVEGWSVNRVCMCMCVKRGKGKGGANKDHLRRGSVWREK